MTNDLDTLLAALDVEIDDHVVPPLAPGSTVLTDKGLAGRDIEGQIAELGVTMPRPDRRDEKPRHGARTAQRLLALAAAIWHNWVTDASESQASSPTTTNHQLHGIDHLGRGRRGLPQLVARPAAPGRAGAGRRVEMPGTARQLESDQVQELITGYQAGATVYELAEHEGYGRGTRTDRSGDESRRAE